MAAATLERAAVECDLGAVPPVFRPFRPSPARTVEQARALGRAWAEHEARDPGGLKGRPGERPEFFYFFDEAAQLVAADGSERRDELIEALGVAACARWRELGQVDNLAWTFDSAEVS